MKKLLIGGAVVLFAVLALSGSASAQAVGQSTCGSTVGYGDTCPDKVERPAPDVQPAAVSTLPRTGSDSSMPLARTAVVLIGVGAAMTILANRHRLQRIPA
jgi:hypothetical protein